MSKKIATDIRHKVTVSDLIQQCNDAAACRSIRDPDGMLFVNCAFALRQLVDRLAEYESGWVPGPEEPQ